MQNANFSFWLEKGPPDRQVLAFAFSAIYLALCEIGDAGEVALRVARERWEIDRLKMRRLRVVYERIDREGVRSQAEFREFVNVDKFWPPSYYAWCAISNRQQAESTWPKFDAAPDLLHGEFALPHFDAQLFHVWVQYHCHRQLVDSSTYAMQHRVALSCTLIIGQHKHSADVWSYLGF
jgi:4-alpha-glucanotransferase